jgi:hypothetical protein
MTNEKLTSNIERPTVNFEVRKFSTKSYFDVES